MRPARPETPRRWPGPCGAAAPWPGREAPGDLREGKKTYPVLAALDAHSPAAVLIDEAGGRAAALAEASRHVTAVESALDDVPIAAGAGDDLRSLLDFLVRRDL